MERVTRTTVLCGSVEQAWDDVTSGDWLGDSSSLDLRRGADGWVREGDDLRHLVVEDVRPPHRLVFRWWPVTTDGVGPASRVELDLEPDDDEVTRLVVVEAPVAPATPVPTASGPVALATL